MTAVDLAHVYRRPKHRARPDDFDWVSVARVLVWPALLALALVVFTAWAFVVAPVLIPLIGLWPTRAVGVALTAATLWRRS